MTSVEFSRLTIDFSQNDKASIFYAHLQNVIKQLINAHIMKQYEKQSPIIQKIDIVLYEVFMEFQKLRKQYFDVSKNMKDMLLECTTVINQCKTDRQILAKVTQDRQDILQKLKSTTETTLEFVKQNQTLRETVDKMKEINDLLFQKNKVLEDQLTNQSTTNQGVNNVLKISKEFQRISENNFNIQKDIADILKTTQTYGNASQPLQIMCLAFKEKPQWREQFWTIIAENHANKFDNLIKTKQNFYNFDYIDALMLSTNSKSE